MNKRIRYLPVGLVIVVEEGDVLLLLAAVDVEHGSSDGSERVFTVLPP